VGSESAAYGCPSRRRERPIYRVSCLAAAAGTSPAACGWNPGTHSPAVGTSPDQPGAPSRSPGGRSVIIAPKTGPAEGEWILRHVAPRPRSATGGKGGWLTPSAPAPGACAPDEPSARGQPALPRTKASGREPPGSRSRGGAIAARRRRRPPAQAGRLSGRPLRRRAAASRATSPLTMCTASPRTTGRTWGLPAAPRRGPGRGA